MIRARTNNKVTEAAADAELARRVGAARRRWALTTRQTEVLGLVIRGMANKEIASALGLQEGTIEAHVSRMLRKLGAESRAKLVARFWVDG